MQRLFKRSTDEVVEGSHQIVDFALDSDPSDPPPSYAVGCVEGAFGSTPSHSRGQAKGSRVLVLPGTMDHIKGLGGRQQLYVQGFCV